MFVDTAYIRRPDGSRYPRHLLRTSFRDHGKVKHETIANLSHCTEDEIRAIRLALKHKRDLAVLRSATDVKLREGMRVGAVCTLKAIAERVGLPRALGTDRQAKLALWQVFARLIDQGSRLSAVTLAESHAATDLLGLDAFHEDHLYRNLAWLADHQARIEHALFRSRYGEHGIPQFFLYDVTSSYLEGIENVLAAFGYNRDGKRGKRQLVVGLLTGPDGAPVAVRVFAGNTQDPKTVAEQVRMLAHEFGVKEITLVGDRGMIKSQQVDLLAQAHFHYITAITKPQIRTLITLGVLQRDLFDEHVCEVEAEGVRYVLRRNPVRATEMARNREAKLQSLTTLVTERNSCLQQHPRAKAAIAKRAAVAQAKRLAMQGWVTIRRRGRVLEVAVDEAARAAAADLDGCYALKTDLSTQTAGTEEVHDRYKDLAKVERAFRTFKQGHLEMQPWYVRCEASTRGHAFVIMLAYLVERELDRCWHDMEQTVPQGIDELGSLRGVEVTLDGVTVQQVPDPDGLTARLLNAAGVTLPEVLPCRKVHVATRKKLVDKRQHT